MKGKQRNKANKASSLVEKLLKLLAIDGCWAGGRQFSSVATEKLPMFQYILARVGISKRTQWIKKKKKITAEVKREWQVGWIKEKLELEWKG